MRAYNTDGVIILLSDHCKLLSILQENSLSWPPMGPGKIVNLDVITVQKS